MRVHKLERQQFFKKSIEEVFAYFDRPENLQEITPSFLNFKVLTPRPIRMEKGALIDYALSLFGFPLRWTSYISAYDPPRYFVDTQLRGPYAFWHHQHFFESKDGGTWVRDEVQYSLPFGAIGQLIGARWIQKQLDSIFDGRAKVLQERLGHDQ